MATSLWRRGEIQYRGRLQPLRRTWTYPAMAPVQNPTTLHFLSNLKSRIIQTIPPTDPARLVLNAAMAAFKLAANVLPALKPSHPTQSKTVPRMT